MSAVSDALVEVDAAIAAMAPAHEGLRDYERLNLETAALEEVREAIGEYDRRLQALMNAKAALEALLADGYPALDVEEIAAAAYEDLAANAATIQAALATFRAAEASSLSLSAGEAQPK